MNNSKRIISCVLAITTIASLSGCSTSVFKDDVASYQLVPQLTANEVIDYYSKAMSFDSIITKNIDVDKTTYETKEVTDQTKLNQLKSALSKTESVLKQMQYQYTDENNEAVNEETFHYIKAYLNDRKLSNGTIQQINQALGYYFIDVQYDIGARTAGTFTNQASMVGLNGAFIHSEYYNTDSVDNAYMTQAQTKLNAYYADNNILNKKATFNKATGIFSTDPNTSGSLDFTDSTAVDNQPIDEPTDEDTAPVQKVDEQGNPVVDEDGNPVYEEPVAEQPSEEPTPDSVSATSSVLNSRSPHIDVSEFNTVVGSSTKQTAYMPELTKVYNIPAPEGTFSGIGIYPSGIGGLTKFGFNRGQLAGTVTLRFVYKDDLTNPNKLLNINIYPVFSEITTGFSANNDNIIPEFLMTEFEKLLERADRAIANCDLSALMSGNIYSDMGVAILRGYEDQHVNVLRQISTIRRVLSRDINNSSYLLEVESQRQEGPKGADVYGTYRDKSYVVVEQHGQSFVITDWLTMTRQMQTEPDINPDSAVSKRLVALNLAGEVSEESKKEVTGLLGDLYKASTYRVLNGPKDIETSNGTETIQRGMYDCFDPDPEMLSSTRKEDINSKLRGMLVKHGTSTSAQHYGIVTEWIGGADNQVEFTTEEIITYQGRNDGIYMTCYYLVSKMQDTWVIDDLQIISSEEHSGQNLQSDIDRIKG